MNWVPFRRARPSFDCKVIGSHPISFQTSSLGLTSPLYRTSPRPRSGRLRWARGARSPDAPKDPCWYTTGRMSLLNMSRSRWTVMICAPEWPYERDWALRSSISLTISGLTVSPVPHA